MPLAPDNADQEKHLKDINEELYKHSVDLAIRNKVLSLLRELYQISILTLAPKELAQKISQAIQTALDLEFFSIFLFDENAKTLTPLSFAKSVKLVKAETTLGCSIESALPSGRVSPLFAKVIAGRQMVMVNHLDEVLSEIETEANIKTSLLYPIEGGDRVIGVLIISLNRTLDKLSQFEQESINNLVNIVAVALDKSLLYQQIQMANEKLKELDKQKTEFVSIASHQLRAPLTAIKGYSSMLLEGSFDKLGKKSTEAVERINESSERLVNIIEDFLNITRIELGKMKYGMVDFDLGKLLKDITPELGTSLKNRGLVLKQEITAEPCLYHGDSGKLRQVFINLIDNAIKYTAKGEVKIKLEKSAGTFKFTVTDTGIGLSPGAQKHLFEKFIRADGNGGTNITGTGLGLYVAKQIVEAHKGKIWAESAGPGKGSTFIVELGSGLTGSK